MRENVGLLTSVTVGLVLALLVYAALNLTAPSSPPQLTLTSLQSKSTSLSSSQSTSSTGLQSESSSFSRTTEITFVKSNYLYSTSSSFCGAKTGVTYVNGTAYCTDNVTNDTVVQDPGYTYFLNESITFMGVTFRAICQANYNGCPGTTNVTVRTTLLAAAITVSLTFSDNTSETMGQVIGDSGEVTLLSAHVDPKAGVMIVRNGPDYDAFLLVEEIQ
ncbi:MAG: hypothetical protein ACYC7D_05615 [Nitrososphaerales archaeon]